MQFQDRSISPPNQCRRWLTALILAMTAAIIPWPAAAQTAMPDQSLFQSPKEGGARRLTAVSELQLRKKSSPNAAIHDTFQAGAVFSNMGCQDISGDIWCQIRPFRGGARGYVLASLLEPAAGPDGAIPTGVDDSEKRAMKQDFDAQGVIQCAQEAGEALGKCTVGIATGDGGDATAIATFSNGFARRLYFRNGEFVSANSTMSGAGRDTDWQLDDGMHKIRVDDQRYNIPDTLVFGK